MNVFFDTSVLVPALVDQLSNHPACFAVFRTYTSGENSGYCSTHSLAECYSVLTSLPLPRRVSTVEARLLIEESIMKNLNVVALTQSDYSQAITAVSNNALAGGIIYDALHAAAARKSGYSRLYTYNLIHFTRLGFEDIEIRMP
ncbi:MAG: type II toxin-antitoxin system VapC family toxin [Spirochaetia bacterium]